MSEIKFTKDEIDRIVSKVKTYFAIELEQEIGSFEAEFLVEFFAKEIGAAFYNRGISDAHAIFTEKSDEIGYLFQELEKHYTHVSIKQLERVYHQTHTASQPRES